MVGRCRPRRLEVLEYARVSDLLQAVDGGKAITNWPVWFRRAYETGVVGIGPGLKRVTIRYVHGADVTQRIAGYDDIIVNESAGVGLGVASIGVLRSCNQTEFDEVFEVID